jgi:hypothetical protein
MLQTKEHAPTATGVDVLTELVADNPKIITDQDGRPIVALIHYELYLAIQETIDQWYAAQRAANDSQAWYWTPAWQRMEAEAEADLREGRSRTFNTMTELIHDLQSGDDE